VTYVPASNRYAAMRYNRCGVSGLLLPAVSLGLWNNFGHDRPLDSGRAIVRRAFDLGITHFDLANNYGPPYGSAEENFGRLVAQDLAPYRDELVISTKAGYDMWPGPYGDRGSRKYLLASLDQSLRRMGLEYVDIFYSHRLDPDTPLEETMGALDTAVRQGKALYVGISSYSASKTREAAAILRSLGTRLLIHQPSYSLLNRWIEPDLLDTLGEDHVRMVRALGFPERTVFARFALKPAMNPVIAVTALVFAYSLANTFLVEAIFDWGGLGSYAADAIQSLDTPAIIGVTLFIALVYVAANLLVDIVQAIFDPRIRLQ